MCFTRAVAAIAYCCAASPTVLGPTALCEDQPPRGECGFASATDAAVLRAVFEGQGRRGRELLVVECGACDTAWHVPNSRA